MEVSETFIWYKLCTVHRIVDRCLPDIFQWFNSTIELICIIKCDVLICGDILASAIVKFLIKSFPRLSASIIKSIFGSIQRKIFYPIFSLPLVYVVIFDIYRSIFVTRLKLKGIVQIIHPNSLAVMQEIEQ